MTKWILLLSCFGLTAFAQNRAQVTTLMLEAQKNALICQTRDVNLMESKLWDVVADVAPNSPIRAAGYPGFQEYQSVLLQDSELTSEVKVSLSELYDLLMVQIPHEQQLSRWKDLRDYWVSLEVGDHTDKDKVRYQKQLKKIFTHLGDTPAFARTTTRVCDTGREQKNLRTKTPDWYTPFSGKYSRVQAGARWAFENAYQMCSPVVQAPLNKDTPDIVGIKELGPHPDGVGVLRVIDDLPSFLKTNYYFQGQTAVAKGCFNTFKNPLIYDYGGKPYTDGGDLNFFVNDGDGTSALGIDCSGFVFSALATAGLKLNSTKPLKASLVHGISSALYVQPAKNGFDCLDKISIGPTSDMKPGDIGAVLGHVFFIHSVGKDPWGIRNAKVPADCDQLSPDNFNFTIMQSNPAKKGIGINVMEIKDDLPDSPIVRAGLLKYAKVACLNKISGTTTKPDYSDVAIDRHKLTTACITTRIPLESEQCIASCAQLYQ